jgi:hypothetical protein
MSFKVRDPDNERINVSVEILKIIYLVWTSRRDEDYMWWRLSEGTATALKINGDILAMGFPEKSKLRKGT